MPDIFISPSPHTEVDKEEPQVLPVEKFGHSHSRFSAFNLYPKNVNFQTKGKEEKVILMLRQHPIVNLKWIFFSIILFFSPFAFTQIGFLELLPKGYPMILVMVWYMVTFIYAVEGFFKWYFNVFFITPRRVIDVDFSNLVYKRVSEAEIDKIQDVSYSTSGAIGTVFNFGDISIQTSSEVRELSLEGVPSPEKVAKILNDIIASVH